MKKALQIILGGKFLIPAFSWYFFIAFAVFGLGFDNVTGIETFKIIGAIFGCLGVISLIYNIVSIFKHKK